MQMHCYDSKEREPRHDRTSEEVKIKSGPDAHVSERKEVCKNGYVTRM
jgi:hypothetical protein